MKIKNLNNISLQDLNQELKTGGKFVIYEYCYSLIVISFKRTSDIYFIRSSENATKKGLKYTLLTLVAGWWGIPWGPVYSVGCLAQNLSGGKNVTREVIESLKKQTTDQQ